MKEYLILYRLYNGSRIRYNTIIVANNLQNVLDQFNIKYKDAHGGYTDRYDPVILKIL